MVYRLERQITQVAAVPLLGKINGAVGLEIRGVGKAQRLETARGLKEWVPKLRALWQQTL